MTVVIRLGLCFDRLEGAFEKRVRNDIYVHFTITILYHLLAQVASRLTAKAWPPRFTTDIRGVSPPVHATPTDY